MFHAWNVSYYNFYMVHAGGGWETAILIKKKLKGCNIIVPLYRRKFCDGYIMQVHNDSKLFIFKVILTCTLNETKFSHAFLKLVFRRKWVKLNT